MGWDAVCRDSGAGALMALTLNNFTGFETQGDEEASSTIGTPIYNTTSPMDGGADLELDSASTWDLPWVEGVTDAGTAWIVGAAFKKSINPD
ncbi:hypothetical protein LCGC14_1528850, partial [marine sediment metagenome]